MPGTVNTQRTVHLRPLLLIVAGMGLLALGTVGLRWLVSMVALFGIRPETPHLLTGILAEWLIGGGLVALISGLILALVRTQTARAEWLFWSGIALLCLGSGPLMAVILAAHLGVTANPDPNPVLLGLVAMLTLLPALMLISFGWVAWRGAKIAGDR